MSTLFWILLLLMTLIAMLWIWMPFYKNFAFLRLPTSIWFLFVSFPLCSITLYAWLGHAGALQNYWVLYQQHSHVQPLEDKKLTQYLSLITQLSDHLQQHPESAQGWYLLGRLYLHTEQYALAEDSLLTAMRLNPDNRDYLVMAAKANFFNHQMHLSNEMSVALEQLVQHFPENLGALNLLAADAYHQGDYWRAVHYWKQALKEVPPGSHENKMLVQLIQAVQNQTSNKKEELLLRINDTALPP